MTRIWAILLTTLGGTALAQAPGERLMPFALQDQFEQTARLTDTTKLVLVASSRAAAGIVDEAIKDQPKGYLEARNALYVEHVSQMPRLITSCALAPSMRWANDRSLADWDSGVATGHLGADGKVLWVQLNQRETLEQQTFTSATALRDALERQMP